MLLACTTGVDLVLTMPRMGLLRCLGSHPQHPVLSHGVHSGQCLQCQHGAVWPAGWLNPPRCWAWLWRETLSSVARGRDVACPVDGVSSGQPGPLGRLQLHIQQPHGRHRDGRRGSHDSQLQRQQARLNHLTTYVVCDRPPPRGL